MATARELARDAPLGLEIVHYDWWPFRADARMFDRLDAMPVRIAGT